MSECNLWWKAGDVQWCDMMGDMCQCGGWDERCNMKAADDQYQQVRFSAQSHTMLWEDEEN